MLITDLIDIIASLPISGPVFRMVAMLALSVWLNEDFCQIDTQTAYNEHTLQNRW